MSPVHNGWRDNSRVDREADGSRMAASDTVGHDTAAAATARGDDTMPKLLLIEDDKETADEIRAELGDHGFEVD
jgi:hypothetical protein